MVAVFTLAQKADADERAAELPEGNRARRQLDTPISVPLSLWHGTLVNVDQTYLSALQRAASTLTPFMRKLTAKPSSVTGRRNFIALTVRVY